MKKILSDGRYQIAAMILFFILAFLFNLKNPEPGLCSMPLVSRISIGISALLLVVFLARTLIRK